MPRRMSCSMTVEAVRARTKTVTRRHVDTWRTLKPGDRLTLIEKGMGLPKGARQVKLAEVEITSVRVELLLHTISDVEVEREGLAELTPDEFCEMWMGSHGYGRLEALHDREAVECRRIEWVYLDPPTELTDFPIAPWGEDGEILLHFGHVDEARMVELVRVYMRDVMGFTQDEVHDHTCPPVVEVRQHYVRPSPGRRWDPDEPWLDWSSKVTAENGWPVTIWEFEA